MLMEQACQPPMDYDAQPLLSFCITSLRRNDQIMQTLPLNLAQNWQDRSMVEFVLVDFNPSIDDDHSLEQFVLQQCRRELDCGYLCYFQSDALPSWHASIAKNTAHSVARGRVLVNLDGDNFVGEGGGRHVLRLFYPNAADESEMRLLAEPRPVVLQQRCGAGTYGRIALRRGDFETLGGYNESFAPMSAQDLDLMQRAAALLNTRVVYDRDSTYSYAIANDKQRSVRFCTEERYADMSWHQMSALNRDAMRRSRQQFGLLCNVDQPYIGVTPSSLQYYCAVSARLVPYEGFTIRPPNSAMCEQHRQERPEAFNADIGRLNSAWSPERMARMQLLRRTLRTANADRRAALIAKRRERLERLKQQA